MGVLISLVILQLFYKLRGWRLITPVAALIFLLIIHSVEYLTAFQNRRYVIKQVNEYLAQFKFQDKPVIGPWAGTCNWESKALTLPVWHGAFNFKDPVHNFSPAIIISEPDEEDSGFNYSKQQIDLTAISDSIKHYKIGHWNVNLYWIKNE
jgi:hypothetical protein